MFHSSNWFADKQCYLLQIKLFYLSFQPLCFYIFSLLYLSRKVCRTTLNRKDEEGYPCLPDPKRKHAVPHHRGTQRVHHKAHSVRVAGPLLTFFFSPVLFFSLIMLGIFFYHYFLLLLIFFYFTILDWFCHTSTWIHHGCTWVPKHEPPSHLPPQITSLGHPRAPAPSILYPASDRLTIRFLPDAIPVSVPFSRVVPPAALGFYMELLHNTGTVFLHSSLCLLRFL